MALKMKQEWKALCSKYTSDAALAEQLWEELEQAYTSGGRHYHTLDHLAYMLQLSEKYKQDISKYDLLRFAIFYHDIVYSPSRSDNEAQSAELAGKRLMKVGLPAEDRAFVREMILATKAHQQHTDATINFLLDLDLAILGADPQTYKAYSRSIRKEYNMYPELLYKPGRKKVLQQFLSQPHIYKTPVFQQKYEAQARQNLQQEVQLYS